MHQREPISEWDKTQTLFRSGTIAEAEAPPAIQPELMENPSMKTLILEWVNEDAEPEKIGQSDQYIQSKESTEIELTEEEQTEFEENFAEYEEEPTEYEEEFVEEYDEGPHGHRGRYAAAAVLVVMTLLTVLFVNAQRPSPKSTPSRSVVAQNVLPKPQIQTVKPQEKLEVDTKLPAEIPHVVQKNRSQKTDESAVRFKQPVKNISRQSTKAIPRESSSKKATYSRKSTTPPERIASKPLVDTFSKPETRLANPSRKALPDDQLTEEQRTRKGRYLSSVGTVLMKRGEVAEAVEVLQRSVRAFPPGTDDIQYAHALHNLALAWRKAGRPDKAIPILEERLKFNNQRDVIQRELATAKRQARDESKRNR
jgi:tetratricopeptide (TPR) repeat protein